METFLVLLNIVLISALIFVLIRMQQKHVSFSKRVFSGLGLGVLLGVYLQTVFGADSAVTSQTTDWYNIAGRGYVRLLMMIVIPLIMVSIIQSIINLEKTSELGRISLWIIGTLVGTTAIAALVGIGSSFVFDLNASEIEAGQAESDRGTYLEETLTEVQDLSTPEKILEFIPANPFLDMTGDRATSTIAVVIFSAIVGIAVLGVRRKQPEHAKTFINVVNAFYAVVMRIVTLVLRLTPIGILGLMATTVAQTNIAGILELGKFVLASYAALAVMFIIHLVLIGAFGLNPFTYLKKVLPVLTFAFTSRSSAGTIPLNISAQKNSLGVDEGVANMSASFGATIGQNGCAGIYPAMLAVMIAPSVGIDPLSPGFLVQLVLIVAISSFGVAGVGGGATFAALIVLSSMNLPVALAGLLISVEPLIDMGRTALNVNGAMTSGTLTSRVLKKLNIKRFNDKEAVEKDIAV
ncbi:MULTISPECIES: L-cystine transporter [Halobacillus]|uniref:L-cystine transporter n=1 Tax=Halobacillus TaxID=45667 RepID=UPI0013722084|nr:MULTISPECIES: L-cystine transporter [Halobacillus]MCA1022074.1 L-cystine transporter [Halobacillus litoralis]MYL30022.1 cation:dicarboxylase symporter family transporter [Halobacillus halophilus]MYL37515.1 cation:dicarboxylase symporter family transporter [Halobacillus litoralis]